MSSRTDFDNNIMKINELYREAIIKPKLSPSEKIQRECHCTEILSKLLADVNLVILQSFSFELKMDDKEESKQEAIATSGRK
jgi:hypothetical protein